MNGELQLYVDTHGIAQLLNDIATDLLVWKSEDPLGKAIQFLEKRLRKQVHSEVDRATIGSVTTDVAPTETAQHDEAAKPLLHSEESADVAVLPPPVVEQRGGDESHLPSKQGTFGSLGTADFNTPDDIDVHQGFSISSDLTPTAASCDDNPIVKLITRLDSREALLETLIEDQSVLAALTESSAAIRRVFAESKAAAAHLARLQSAFDGA